MKWDCCVRWGRGWSVVYPPPPSPPLFLPLRSSWPLCHPHTPPDRTLSPRPCHFLTVSQLSRHRFTMVVFDFLIMKLPSALEVLCALQPVESIARADFVTTCTNFHEANDDGTYYGAVRFGSSNNGYARAYKSVRGLVRILYALPQYGYTTQFCFVHGFCSFFHSFFVPLFLRSSFLALDFFCPG